MISNTSNPYAGGYLTILLQLGELDYWAMLTRGGEERLQTIKEGHQQK